MFPISSFSIFVNKNSFNGLFLLIFEEKWTNMALDQNPHQTVTHFGCVGFSMYACGFSAPQRRQICLFTYPPRSKRAEKMIVLAKIGIFCKSIASPLSSVVQAYTQTYSFGGRIKLIICQIRHELLFTT